MGTNRPASQEEYVEPECAIEELRQAIKRIRRETAMGERPKVQRMVRVRISITYWDMMEVAPIGDLGGVRVTERKKAHHV